MLKKQKGDFGTAHFFFSPVYSCMKFTIKLPRKRNTIFNTTIQKKPFSCTLLKKKPSKLKKKREKRKSPSSRWGRGEKAGRNAIQSITNGQTSVHQEAITTTSEKEGVRYVQFARRRGAR